MPPGTAATRMSQVLYDYTRADSSGASCVAHAWAKVPEPLTPTRRAELKARIAQEFKARQAVLVAHYYVDGDLQDLALETGGCVADSLEMARFGRDHAAQTLIVAGVRFMGETAKILSPHKRVLMPDLDATCSLDLGCPPDEFARFCDAHPDRKVVVYANTSAAVKARADWMVTSSCALAIVEHLHRAGEKILWAPDRHLGRYIQQRDRRRHADVGRRLHRPRRVQGHRAGAAAQEHPAATVLVHPESPEPVIAQADVVGSTSQLLKAVVDGTAREYIVATDNGMFHRMRQLAPGKTLIEAPTAGHSATCKSCAHCPWMAMNALGGVLACLEQGQGEILVPEPTRSQALGCIDRMLDFVAKNPSAIVQPQRGFVRDIGVA